MVISHLWFPALGMLLGKGTFQFVQWRPKPAAFGSFQCQCWCWRELRELENLIYFRNWGELILTKRSSKGCTGTCCLLWSLLVLKVWSDQWVGVEGLVGSLVWLSLNYHFLCLMIRERWEDGMCLVNQEQLLVLLWIDKCPFTEPGGWASVVWYSCHPRKKDPRFSHC